MKQLQFYNDQVPNFSIVLSTRNHTHLGQLRNINYDSIKHGGASLTTILTMEYWRQ